MTLTQKQIAAARALRTARPAVIPGTNVIPNGALRLQWFDSVCDAMRRESIAHPALVKDFCDRAGVPD